LRILVITAHPHYAGTNCAGTLFNHASRGDEVYVVSLTAGDLMTDRVTRAELAKINQADMEASADILGFKETRILGFQDGEVENVLEVRIALNRVIRELKPDTVFTHWYPNSTIPDFKYTGEVVVDAMFCALLVSGRWVEELPSHWTSRAYGFEEPALTSDYAPNVFVDITDVIETKTKSIDCFAIHCESNFGGDFDLFHSAYLGPNRYWGIHSGVTYAESFQQIKTHEVQYKAVKHVL
jgi:LmbE family N-acetylglucosaminyl deacetylase